jgi:hypothetical protein
MLSVVAGAKDIERSRMVGGKEIEIEINGRTFRVASAPLTGAELRQLATPPLGSDQDLLQVTERSGESDLLINDGQVVDFESGARFFSVPRRILAG